MADLFTLMCVLVVYTVTSTPLDDYVNKPDPHYSYTIIGTHNMSGFTIYTVNMTSQKWKSEDVLDHPVWWHYISISVPDVIKYKTGLLFIEGKNNDNNLPKPEDKFVALTGMFAAMTGAVTANLRQVPNQPLVFKADPRQQKRTEDASIAWTWKTFIMDPTDPEILLRMPMTKAAVRAMDTVTDMVRKERSHVVDTFMVAGESKRGWTTWTTGAVDKRVIAIAPIVMDLLNFGKNLHHHFRALGGWTFEFNDYYSLNFTQDLDNPNIQKMADIIDPLSYSSRLSMPKLVITTSGDEFFMPDDSNYWYNQLSQPTYLRVIPNAEHGIKARQTSMFLNLRAFYLYVVTKTPLPKVEWIRATTSSGGAITVVTDQQPLSIHTYWAQTLSNERRDFRLFVLNKTQVVAQPVVWHPKDTTKTGLNTYHSHFANPTQGWLGFFIQLTFQGPLDSVLEVTTEVQIVPTTFPFADCQGNSCRGTLV